MTYHSFLQDNHNVIDLTAFNTDGFDVSGRNVWIHDCTVWNQGRTEMGCYLIYIGSLFMDHIIMVKVIFICLMLSN